jgi:hypothetical protein
MPPPAGDPWRDSKPEAEQHKASAYWSPAAAAGQQGPAAGAAAAHGQPPGGIAVQLPAAIPGLGLTGALLLCSRLASAAQRLVLRCTLVWRSSEHCVCEHQQ